MYLRGSKVNSLIHACDLEPNIVLYKLWIYCRLKDYFFTSYVIQSLFKSLTLYNTTDTVKIFFVNSSVKTNFAMSLFIIWQYLLYNHFCLISYVDKLTLLYFTQFLIFILLFIHIHCLQKISDFFVTLSKRETLFFLRLLIFQILFNCLYLYE